MAEYTNDEMKRIGKKLRLSVCVDYFIGLGDEPAFQNGDMTMREFMSGMLDALDNARRASRFNRELAELDLPYPDAELDDLKFSYKLKGITRTQLKELSVCEWVKEHRSLLFTGPVGIGKSTICCILVRQCLLKGLRVYFVRMPALLYKLEDMNYTEFAEFIEKLCRYDVVYLDDMFLSGMNSDVMHRFNELTVKLTGKDVSLLMTSQVPVREWRDRVFGSNQYIGEAVIDRIASKKTRRFTLSGPSFRFNTEPEGEGKQQD